VKKRDLERHLSAHGCALVRQAANHEVWQNTATAQRTTVSRHKEIKPPTAPGICRQLGVRPGPISAARAFSLGI